MGKNIFVVGKEVKGETRIGYDYHIKDLTEEILDNNKNISLLGLAKYGKTSLIKEVLNNIKSKTDKNKVITLFVNLAKQETFGGLLVSILNKLKNEIKKLDDENIKLELRECYDDCMKLNQESQSFRDEFEGLFYKLAEYEIQVILAIDEFDKASDIFKSNSEYAYLRDLSGESDQNTTMILISRRQLYMIEHKNINNSTFHNNFKPYTVQGFSDSDLKAYYEVLNQAGIDLSANQKERLEYYCGRSPFLLSIFGEKMVDLVNDGERIDIDAIYKNNLIYINNYYNDVYNCLENDMVVVNGESKKSSSIEKLVGVIIGPKINITKFDVDELDSMGYLSYKGDEYYSLSGLFTTILRDKAYVADSWKEVIALEKKVKAVIRKEMKKEFNTEYITYDMWEDVFGAIGRTSSLDTYDKFISNSMEEYECDVDVLDVASFEISVRMLEYYWESHFSVYFDNDVWDEWEQKLLMCAKARNPMAHGHSEFLSAEENNCVIAYCTEILKILQTSGAAVDEVTELKLAENIAKRDVRKKYYRDVQSGLVENSMLNQQVTFTAADVDNKVIKGYYIYNGKEYRGSIGKTKWAQKFPGTPFSNHLAKNFQVKIDKVNLNYNTVSLVLL